MAGKLRIRWSQGRLVARAYGVGVVWGELVSAHPVGKVGEGELTGTGTAKRRYI